MMLLYILLSTIKWQVAYSPVDDSSFNMNVLLEIPAQILRFTTVDSLAMATYEIQVVVFDKKKNQVAGDYWFREREKDSTNFYDSLNLIIPKTAWKFNLKIIDLQGVELLNVNENIKTFEYLANVRSRFINDTITITFTVLNPKNKSADINVYLKDMKKTKPLRSGIYEDTINFFVGPLSNGRYELQFVIDNNGKRIEALSVPIEIDRPFYLDEKTWYLRVSQLEYIATPNELNQLRKAKVEARDSLWKAFWKQYDPTPNTEYNEREKEYFERIAYADEHFSFGDKGWRSDRGRIYVKFGPPDEIQSRPYELSTKPYEIWLYYRLNLRFIFYDRHGFGEYILINPQGERI
uniref:GWxTD domain-containing protein n=1 Tax=candidate division WOR-3 bacterium TaxID=2052148 RepID=A0A7C6EI58_UNCW3